MIKFYSQTLDSEVTIRFKHITEKHGPEALGTDCFITISQRDGQQKMASASSFCHPKDSFSRVVGRKVSLANALKVFLLTKDQKKEIWHKLFQRVNK